MKVDRHLRNIYLVCGLVLIGMIFGTKLSEAATYGAATYYVAKTGSDSNTCTQAKSTSTPKLTINSGKGCLVAGDTLIVKAGTYAESVMNIPAGTAWTNPVTVKAAAGEVVTVRPASGGGHPFGFNATGSKYVIVDGFVIDAVNVGYGVFVDSDVDRVRIKDCEIKNATHQGIFMGGNFHEIIGNHVHHVALGGCITGVGKCHGMYLTGDSYLIEGNDVHDSESHGIHIYNGSACCPDDAIVRNNVVHDNIARGIGVYNGQRNKIYNNVFYHTAPTSTYVGIHLAANNGWVYNNTVYNNRIGIHVSGSGNMIRNNIAFSNSSSNIKNLGSNNTLSNNLTTDPSFVQATSANFSLQSGSAAINKGVTAGAVTDDYAGVPRPQGSAYDIGAYEYVSGLATPTNLKFVSGN